MRLTSQIQISKTDTPSHLNNSFCLKSIFLPVNRIPSIQFWSEVRCWQLRSEIDQSHLELGWARFTLPDTPSGRRDLAKCETKSPPPTCPPSARLWTKLSTICFISIQLPTWVCWEMWWPQEYYFLSCVSKLLHVSKVYTLRSEKKAFFIEYDHLKALWYCSGTRSVEIR